MKFITFKSHGAVNPAFIKRWNYHHEKGTLTLHIHNEGEVSFSGQEALDGKAQLEAIPAETIGTAAQTDAPGR